MAETLGEIVLADIFVSYARQDKARVAPLVAALESQGWIVWWDPAIVPGQEFDALIRKEIKTASVVVVVWTPASVASRWVRGEAQLGAEHGVLVPVRFERAELPIDAMAVHTTDLDEWREDRQSPQFRELRAALSLHLRDVSRTVPGSAPRTSICVLPFMNMSNDTEQEYFSDGITEDIITDLSKVSALAVIARNTAFTFKGKHVDIPQVARQLKVSHVLEGSVRKSGNRVRITGEHLWAERYDRNLGWDPLSLAVSATTQYLLHGAGRRAEAAREYERSLDLIGDRITSDYWALLRAWDGGPPQQVLQRTRQHLAGSATLFAFYPTLSRVLEQPDAAHVSQIIDRVISAVRRLPEMASLVGIPRAEQQHVASAFRLAEC